MLQQILPTSGPTHTTTSSPDRDYTSDNEDFEAQEETLHDIFQNIIATSKNFIEQEYEVEAILGSRTSLTGEQEYLVNWKNYSNRSNSWVKQDNMRCAELIERYKNANRVGKFSLPEQPLLRIGDRWLVPYTTGIYKFLIFNYYLLITTKNRYISKILLGGERYIW